MSTSEITPASPAKASAGRTSEAPQVNMKGPFAMTQVNESIQREQQGLGPFVHKDKKKSKKGSAGEIVFEGGGEPVRHFKLLSLSESFGVCSTQELMSQVGLAYAILNSWTAMATSLSIALPSGGPTAVVWGLIVSFLGNLAMSASLAEM